MWICVHSEFYPVVLAFGIVCLYGECQKSVNGSTSHYRILLLSCYCWLQWNCLMWKRRFEKFNGLEMSLHWDYSEATSKKPTCLAIVSLSDVLFSLIFSLSTRIRNYGITQKSSNQSGSWIRKDLSRNHHILCLSQLVRKLCKCRSCVAVCVLLLLYWYPSHFESFRWRPLLFLCRKASVCWRRTGSNGVIPPVCEHYADVPDKSSSWVRFTVDLGKHCRNFLSTESFSHETPVSNLKTLTMVACILWYNRNDQSESSSSQMFDPVVSFHIKVFFSSEKLFMTHEYSRIQTEQFPTRS